MGKELLNWMLKCVLGKREQKLEHSSCARCDVANQQRLVRKIWWPVIILLCGTVTFHEFHVFEEVGSGLWTKNTAFWARDWGQKKGAVRLRPWKEALREFGHPKSYPVNSLLVNVSPSKGPSYCSLNLILGLN